MTEKKAKKAYEEGIGRRKRAIARVRLSESSKPSFVVNDKDLKEYFPLADIQKLAQEALLLTDLRKTTAVSARVNGGGVSSQAEAIRLGTARAILKEHPDLRATLKHAGFLKRDPRQVERKKFGLRKARRAPQWSKR